MTAVWLMCPSYSLKLFSLCGSASSSAVSDGHALDSLRSATNHSLHTPSAFVASFKYFSSRDCP